MPQNPHRALALVVAVFAASAPAQRQAPPNPDLRRRIRVRRTLGPTDFAEDFNSWLGGMLGPAHILRQSAMFRRQNSSKAVDGLFYAGATTAPGVGVPMCLISAELVLKRLRGDSGPGPLPIPAQ